MYYFEAKNFLEYFMKKQAIYIHWSIILIIVIYSKYLSKQWHQYLIIKNFYQSNKKLTIKKGKYKSVQKQSLVHHSHTI